MTNVVSLRFRAENFAHDLLDRLRGRCCAAPLDPLDGGYSFWRCGLRRGHDGPHRTVNYLWGPGGSIHAPINNPPPWCDRKPTPTRRQARRHEEWQRLLDAKRAHARQEPRP